MRMQHAVGIVLAVALLVPVATAIQAQTAAPVLKKSAPPVRGTAEVGYIKTTKVEGSTIVTTFQVKNLSTGSIAYLQITELWHDKSGKPVEGTGDRQRLKMPLQPGEVGTISLRSPKVAGMVTPEFTFQHANGPVKLTLLKSLK